MQQTPQADPKSVGFSNVFNDKLKMKILGSNVSTTRLQQHAFKNMLETLGLQEFPRCPRLFELIDAQNKASLRTLLILICEDNTRNIECFENSEFQPEYFHSRCEPISLYAFIRCLLERVFSYQ